MSRKEFKDACDKCGKMDFCRGFDGKVLCEKCIQNEMDKQNKKKVDYDILDKPSAPKKSIKKGE